MNPWQALGLVAAAVALFLLFIFGLHWVLEWSFRDKPGRCPRCGSKRHRVHFCPVCGLQVADNYDVETWMRNQRDVARERRRLAKCHDDAAGGA